MGYTKRKEVSRMTIREYLNKCKESNLAPIGEGPDFTELMMDTTSIWSNDSCYGYCILAMQEAGFTEEDIDKVIHSLYSCFEDTTVEAAADYFKRY